MPQTRSVSRQAKRQKTNDHETLKHDQFRPDDEWEKCLADGLDLKGELKYVKATIEVMQTGKGMVGVITRGSFLSLEPVMLYYHDTCVEYTLVNVQHSPPDSGFPTTRLALEEGSLRESIIVESHETESEDEGTRIEKEEPPRRGLGAADASQKIVAADTNEAEHRSEETGNHDANLEEKEAEQLQQEVHSAQLSEEEGRKEEQIEELNEEQEEVEGDEPKEHQQVKEDEEQKKEQEEAHKVEQEGTQKVEQEVEEEEKQEADQGEEQKVEQEEDQEEEQEEDQEEEQEVEQEEGQEVEQEEDQEEEQKVEQEADQEEGQEIEQEEEQEEEQGEEQEEEQEVEQEEEQEEEQKVEKEHSDGESAGSSDNDDKSETLTPLTGKNIKSAMRPFTNLFRQ